MHMIHQKQRQAHTYMENQVDIRCAKCGQVTSTTKQGHRFRCSNCFNEILVQTSSSSSCQEIQTRYSKCLNEIPVETSPGEKIRARYEDRGSNPSHFSWNQSKCVHITAGRGKGKEFSSKVTQSPTTSPASWVSDGKATKKALVCGVSYKNQKYKLRGTLNDACLMRDFLVNRWNFSPDNIRLLTEAEGGSIRLVPTKKNMEDGLRWLVDGCKQGDSLVFYFSGHGISQRELLRGDEVDGKDELLCPVDFSTNGAIRDNDLNSILVRPLPTGVTLHAIVDACHSGTILDLPWFFDPKGNQWVESRPPSRAYKGTNGGRAISFSACRDEQMAADTSAFSNNGMNGALTMSFIQALENSHFNLSYKQLLVAMQEAILKSRGCKIRIILDKFFRRYFVQEPFLSSDKNFDVGTKFLL